MGPCKLSTVVPVKEHTELVSPGQDTCDLDGGVGFLFVLTVDSVRASFIFTLCRCVVCGKASMWSWQYSGRGLCHGVTYC